MTTVFLDPNLYVYSPEEWQALNENSRFKSLVDFLAEISDLESALDCIGEVALAICDDVLAATCYMNPVINDPPNDFYNRQYRSIVASSMRRRRVSIPRDFEIPENIAINVGIQNSVIPEEVEYFLRSVHPDVLRETMHIYHSERTSLSIGSGIFLDEVDLSSCSASVVMSHHALFPIEKKKDASAALEASIKIKKSKLARSDNTWNQYRIVKITLGNDFLNDLRRADFGNLEAAYRERIIYSLVQICARRPITTNEHTMRPQTIRYKDNDYGKWNAYVFQNGPNERDTRCSRIYFAIANGGVLLSEYNGDVH